MANSNFLFKLIHSSPELCVAVFYFPTFPDLEICAQVLIKNISSSIRISQVFMEVLDMHEKTSAEVCFNLSGNTLDSSAEVVMDQIIDMENSSAYLTNFIEKLVPKLKSSLTK